jgi:two-component system cell cycle response regulator
MLSKVLIVDDAAPIHALLRVHLEGEPIELQSAYYGESALRMIAESQPDLVLLDIDMRRGIDGFEVCRRLREDPVTMHTPVIFLTGSSETEQKVCGLELGATDYITKPFHPAELRARVRAALRVKSRIDLLSSKRVKEFMATP